MWITHIRLTKILFRMHEPDKSKGRDLYGLCISLNSCEEICISAVLFVDPGYFVLVTEVVNADQFLFGSFSYQGKKGFFPGFQCVCRNLRGKYRMAGADGLQLFQTVKNASLDRLGIGSVPGKNPVEMAVVEPTGVRSPGRVCFIGVVVELSDFITASKYRDSRKGKKQCMKCYIISDSAADTICISLIIKTLDSCKGGSCSAELGFFCFRIYIDLTPSKGIREKTGKEFIQIGRASCRERV